jgi:hypothetical protein
MTTRSAMCASLLLLGGAAACGATQAPQATPATPAPQAPRASGVEYDRAVASPLGPGDAAAWWYDPLQPNVVVVHARPESAAPTPPTP